MDLLTAIFTAAVDKKRLRPKISLSKKFKHYISVKDPKRCADWMLKYKRKLPEYYISQTELEYLGWRKGETFYEII